MGHRCTQVRFANLVALSCIAAKEAICEELRDDSLKSRRLNQSSVR